MIISDTEIRRLADENLVRFQLKHRSWVEGFLCFARALLDRASLHYEARLEELRLQVQSSQTEVHHLRSELLKALNAKPAASPTRNDACLIYSHSSRTCEQGMKGCIAHHPAEVQSLDPPPVTWNRHASAWLRYKAAGLGASCQKWPEHAALYPSWRERVRWLEELANEAEVLPEASMKTSTLYCVAWQSVGEPILLINFSRLADKKEAERCYDRWKKDSNARFHPVIVPVSFSSPSSSPRIPP